jgi:hypothetical protein
MPPRRRLGRCTLAVTLLASGLLAVAPAAAAFASWLQQTTAAFPTMDTGQFTAVSCSSPNVCMAVGEAETSTGGQLLSETRSLSGWMFQVVPEPVVGSALLGVSCVKSSDCTAVGNSPSGGGTVPLIENWNGTNWAVTAAPAPAGATFSELTAVACTSPVSCLAVGDTQSGGKQVPLAELWNGSKWKIKPVPKPSGQKSSGLSGIACPSASKCFAVGSSNTNDIFKTLAEVWNGSKWLIQKAPSPAKDSLNAVSCRSASSCMAVGSGLAERWNGKSWSLVKIAKPRGTKADLTGVSCTKAGPCYAVGGNFVNSIGSSVAELWNGSKWSVQPVPLNTSADSSLLDGVSCTTATNCTAAGFYHDSTLGDRPLAEDFSIRWQDVSPGPLSASATAAAFNGVSCAKAQSCLTVGTVEDGGQFSSFSEHWDGTGWTDLQLMAKPKITSVANVTCRSASDCLAVGSIQTSPTTRAPLIEHWNVSRWTIQKSPKPAGSARSFLASVSCSGKKSCFAVGFATNSSGQQRTLVEHWNGKSWKITPSPNPAKAQEIQLASVSCPSANSCVAIGTVILGMFAEIWNGKSWKLTSAPPNPKNAAPGQLSSVSCPGPGTCFAVGVANRGGTIVTLAEHWNGKKWSSQPTPVPNGALSSVLQAVSCTSPTACNAVGTEFVSGSSNAIAESWTGKRWVLHSVAAPINSTASGLARVSCNSAVTCMAVGEFRNSSNAEQALAEQYS